MKKHVFIRDNTAWKHIHRNAMQASHSIANRTTIIQAS